MKDGQKGDLPFCIKGTAFEKKRQDGPVIRGRFDLPSSIDVRPMGMKG